MNGSKGFCLFCNFKSDENSPHVTRSTIIPKFVKNQNLSVYYTTLKNEKKNHICKYIHCILIGTCIGNY